MKRLLNTLYVTTEGAYLAKDGEAVAVRIDDEVRLRVPIHTLGGIVVFGRVGASPALMGFCGERNVALSFLSHRGRFLARVQGPVSGNVLLRREQYRRADDPQGSTEIARSIVLAKIANARNVLKRGERDTGEGQADRAAALDHALHELHAALFALERADSLDAVRGIEGSAANAYFGAFDHLIATDKEHFFFRARSRRPPLDNINALLSFLYTILAHDVTAALEAVGLDPAVGFLHRDRPGRPSLALDLMEELRAPFVDRLVLALVNRRQVQHSGFATTESGAVHMNDKTRKAVLTAYQTRKQETITHPFLGEKIDIGLIPHVQAMLLARRLRGDLDAYPPFVWK